MIKSKNILLPITLGLLVSAVSATPPKPASPQSTATQTTPAPAREPGLYMTFQTDMGDIPCKLYEKEAPFTVRKIVGLALGRISYVDPATEKQTRHRLYNALT